MIRLKLLFPDDFFDPDKHLFFRKNIARKGKVVGIASISQPEFLCHRRQFPIHLISNDITQCRTGGRSLRQMPAPATQLTQHLRYILRITYIFEGLLHPRTAYRKKEIVNIRLQDTSFPQMGADIIDNGMLTPESGSDGMHIDGQQYTVINSILNRFQFFVRSRDHTVSPFPLSYPEFPIMGRDILQYFLQSHRLYSQQTGTPHHRLFIKYRIRSRFRSGYSQSMPEPCTMFPFVSGSFFVCSITAACCFPSLVSFLFPARRNHFINQKTGHNQYRN